MVYAVIMNVRAAAKARGGWKGLLQHMYTNGDYPFKFGNHMGTDDWGNKYYENRVDYPYGQHRWVEYADIHNMDSSQVSPEWHGWMTSMNDVPPPTQDRFFEDKKADIDQIVQSNNQYDHGVGYQNPISNYNGMHNQSQVRPRGYNIGNRVVRLPPGHDGTYYTQPGSLYNPGSQRPAEMIGDLDAGDDSVPDAQHRRYKSQKWRDRLLNDAEKKAAEEKKEALRRQTAAMVQNASRGRRGGTTFG